MLITKCKNKEEIINTLKEKKCLVLKCFGCKEVYFPEEEIDCILKEVKGNISNKGRFDYLCREEYVKKYLKCFKNDLKVMARNLFSTLREFEEESVDIIIAVAPPKEGIGLAVYNRLKKAASEIKE